MSRRLTRLSLLWVLMLTGNVWAIGLGDIKLDSALNEPLRAEISLLSASPEEVSELKVGLASAETFQRYGIDRPFFLQGIEFNVVSGGSSGSVVQLRSRSPITEPFITFLVEATWSSGRLLREYTVLLDPPTYTAPGAQQAPAVSAPQRSRPSDSGRIDRQPATTPTPAPQRAQPAPQPSQPARASGSPAQQRSADDSYATTDGGSVTVARGDTLWGVATRVRPDFRLTMNQTMVAIYEANRSAFDGNINRLRAGANLRIPSADEIYQINRGTAYSEVNRHNTEWSGGEYVAAEPATRPSLTLVPPDEEPAGTDYDEDASTYETPSREQEIENRIAELEAADVPNQQSLIEIRDNELATLRQELANIRGEVYEPPVVDTTDEIMTDDDVATDEIMVDDSDEVMTDAAATDETTDEVADTAPDTTNVVTTSRSQSKSFVDKVIEFFSAWGIIIAALVLVAGGLLWFVRRGGGDDDDEEEMRPWDSLDADEVDAGTIASTAALHAPVPEETIVVVEQESGEHPILEDTVEAPAASLDDDAGSGSFGSLEDTFSSETAVNLDQTDPVAEADFHMAYGLYDQAADLINGALESDPTDKSLMSKLCEIYFVWGNKDAFVDAATRLKMNLGDVASAEWDKIVIMGQQIAPDNDLFAGAAVAGATEAVDLSFDEGGDETGALDMDFGAEDSDASDVIDLGAADEEVDFDFSGGETDEEVDFDLDDTAQTPALDIGADPGADSTAEMPAATGETPTIEEQFAGFGDGTAELPSLDEAALSGASSDGEHAADATAEINLDDLDLDLDGISDTEVASLEDLDDTSQTETLSETGINEALDELDLSDATGRNPEIDPEETGVREALNPTPDTAGLVEGMDLSDLENSGMRLAADETGQNPRVMPEEESDSADVDIDASLLDATGLTQVLSEDFAVDTATGSTSDLGDNDKTMLAPGLGDDATIESLPDDAATMLAPMDDDDDDFDFAKTEALPPEAFTGNTDLESTAESPAIAETDVDLDLDDLTAALKVSEIGDTVEQPRDDATVEQPRPSMSDETAEIPTMSLGPDDMSEDLHEARTMTEVGTKLDLARAYVDMGDPAGARSILEEVLDEGDDGQKQQAQQLLDSLPS